MLAQAESQSGFMFMAKILPRPFHHHRGLYVSLQELFTSKVRVVPDTFH